MSDNPVNDVLAALVKHHGVRTVVASLADVCAFKRMPREERILNQAWKEIGK